MDVKIIQLLPMPNDERIKGAYLGLVMTAWFTRIKTGTGMLQCR